MFPDISEHQGAVDWNALGAAFTAGQIEAVSMRAGFGTVRADFQFSRNQLECRARGIPAIFYWFNYPTFNTPQAEAAMFNQVVGPLRPGEAMMGDFEDDPSSNSVFPRGQAGVDWARAFLTALEAPQNATWFYTYTSLFQDVGMGPLLATWPFVWADYSSRTDNPFGAFARQFTDCGSTPGVVGCCDQNRVLKPPLSQWLTPGASVAGATGSGGNMIGLSYRPTDPNFRVDSAYIGSKGSMIHVWHNGAADPTGWGAEDLGGQFDPRFGAVCTWDAQGAAITFVGVGIDDQLQRNVLFGLAGSGNAANPPTGWGPITNLPLPQPPPAGAAGPPGPPGPPAAAHTHPLTGNTGPNP